MHQYFISGLRVASDLALPSAVHCEEAEGAADLTISAADVPLELEHPEAVGQGWQIRGEEFLLRLDDAGVRILVREGREILYAADSTKAAADLPIFLVGTCMAVALQQRGLVVLHGSAVAVETAAGTGAAIFCGRSGAGKSTLASMLVERGHTLLSDDVCALSPLGENRFGVYSDGRMLKLWSASVQQLGLGQQRQTAVREGMDKFYVGTGRDAANAAADAHRAVPLLGVYVLSADNAGVVPVLEPLSIAEAMIELRSNAYRPELVAAMRMEPLFFHVSAALQRHAEVQRLRRPLDFAAAPATVALLEAHWRR